MSTFSSNIEPPGLQDDFDAQPGWPKPVGIVSIVVASLGLICGSCGLIQGAAGMVMQPPAGTTPPPGMTPLMALVQIVGLGMSIVLLVSGIMCVKRNPKSRPVHLIWAVLSLLVMVVGIMLQIQGIAAFEKWMADNPDDQQVKAMANLPMKQIFYAIIALAVLLSGAWPVFCLIWFGLIKKKPQDFGQVRTDFI